MKRLILRSAKLTIKGFRHQSQTGIKQIQLPSCPYGQGTQRRKAHPQEANLTFTGFRPSQQIHQMRRYIGRLQKWEPQGATAGPYSGPAHLNHGVTV